MKNMNHLFFISELELKILKGIEQLKLQLQNNTLVEEGEVALCSGRGWESEPGTAKPTNILNSAFGGS